jgi:hypothetical protein
MDAVADTIRKVVEQVGPGRVPVVHGRMVAS